MVMAVTEQFVTTSNGWSEFVQALPVMWIWSVASAFALGLFVQDLYNPQSWLWQNWRALNVMFEHAECWWEQALNEPIRREAYSRLVFTRDLKNVELRVWGYISGNLAPTLIDSRTGLRCLKNTDLRVILATAPIHEGSPLKPRFGDQDSPHTINPSEVKLVVVEMRSGWRKQSCAVEIYISAPGSQWAIRPIAESQSPFRWPDFRAKP